ncbi:cytochrome c oxidase subunit II [Bacillus solimangrovi]|uniref:Cytochrome c oxidase subunit 2 n=1 Tax=Bacillus solimangrovi TaxID=1305675 RepID=A0A1E5LIK6_9BACI|nr:cytochrome c oxidase subunit II [Bacillus solimangrovi]OEH93914.1 cytochrome c oxidase subunit II [Bacillus solimangrovi]
MKSSMPKLRIFATVAMLALLLSGCSGKPYLSTLQPSGESAELLLDLMLLATGIMTFVVIVVTVIFIYVSIRFRRNKQNENDIPKQIEGNHKLEILWTVIPIILLLILAVPTIAATFKLDVTEDTVIPEDAEQINVMAKLYWWEFEYEDDKIVTSQDLVIPAGERVYFKLKAGDVKHAFWIPAIAGKIDTNTDNTNRMWVQANEPGLFYGKCTELCGPSHALMDFKVRVLAKDEYEQWKKNMLEPAAEPTTELAVQGQEIFNQSCIGCHAVESQDPRPVEARLAPNLSNFADREVIAGILEHNPEELKKWLKDPETLKPGNKMTNTYAPLNDQELDALTEYLYTLTKEQK